MALTLAEANQIVQAALTRAREMNIKILDKALLFEQAAGDSGVSPAISA